MWRNCSALFSPAFARGAKKIFTILCPLVRARVVRQPDFASIVHPDAPGLSAGGHPSTEEIPMNTNDAAESPIMVRKNEENHTYEATIDDKLVGLVVYEAAGESRLVLTHAAVEHHHRNHGIATELITSMLQDVRRNRQTITVYCDVVVEFLRKHPEFTDLVDPVFPGHADAAKQQSTN
jgi:predicted GNAT family acetyltransferase